MKKRILKEKEDLREVVEAEIKKRLRSVHTYLKNPRRDPLLSVSEIFKKKITAVFTKSGRSFAKIAQKMREIE